LESTGGEKRPFSNRLKKWVGVGLVLASGVWFAGLLIVPFAGLSLATKAALGVVFLVLMEGSFYLGVALVGRQLLSRYWRSIKKILSFGRKTSVTTRS